MKKLNVALFALFLPVFAFAQEVSPDLDFFSKAIDLIKLWGGLPWMAKVAAAILLIIASMKVSFLKPLWDKLGAAQTWVAPVLGLLGGVLSLGTSLTWASALAYVFAGAGAVVFHQLLDSVKAIPGIGQIYITIIDFIKAIPFLGAGVSAK